jgi:hypothetical protein
MNREAKHRSLGIVIATWCVFGTVPQASGQQPTPISNENKPAAALTATTADGTAAKLAEPLQIFGLGSAAAGTLISGAGAPSHVGLKSKLWVVLTRPLTLPPNKYALFMNGTEVRGLDPATLDTYRVKEGQTQPALVFTLQRNSTNDLVWKTLLGSISGLHVPVVVSLSEQSAN